MNAVEFFNGMFRTSQSTNGWTTFECPICGKMKGAVNFEYNSVKCWRGCYHTNIAWFMHDIMGVPFGEAKGMVDTKRFRLANDYVKPKNAVCFPEGYVPLWGEMAFDNLHTRARQYLQSRGFDPDVLALEGWGYCNSGEWMGRIIIPYYSKGVLKYYTGRTFIGDPLRYKNPATEVVGTGKAEYFFNEDAFSMDKVFITEGAIDARTIGVNAMASGGWELSPTQLEKLLTYGGLTCFVPDLGGATDGVPFFVKALQLAEKRLQMGKQASICDLRRLGQYGKDVNEIGAERVLKTEIELTFSNLYNLMYERPNNTY